MNRQKIIVYAGIFLDVLGIGVLIPALPELVHYYNVGDWAISLGTAAYAFFAFLAAPIMGQLSDKYGRKWVLVRCVFGSALSFSVLFIPTFAIYIVSRIINGITGGNISIYQAILSDISHDNAERKKNFGLLGALFGLGFIVGPLVGGLLLNYGVQRIFAFCALFGLLETILIVRKYKETNKHITHRKIVYNPLPIFGKYLRQSKYNGVLLSIFFLNTATFCYQSIMTLLLNDKFGIPGNQVGYVLAITGLISAINQGLLVPQFWTKFFGNKKLFYIIHAFVIPLFVILGFMTNMWGFLIVWFAIIPFSSLAMTVYNSEIVQHSHKTEVGEVSGLMGSIGSLTMFVGPLIGSYALLKHIDIFFISAVIGLLSLAAIIYYIKTITPIELGTTNASNTA